MYVRGLLSLTRYQFLFVAKTPLSLPSFYGQTLRGGLSTVLRRLVCVTHLSTCPPCLLKHQCVYPLLFEPFVPPQHSNTQRFARMPVPLMFRIPFNADPLLNGAQELPPYRLQPGDRFVFETTVLDRVKGYLPYLVYAFIELGKQGLGRGRGKCQLESVHVCTLDGMIPVYTAEDALLHTMDRSLTSDDIIDVFRLPDLHRLRIHFVTPTRLDLDSDLVYPIEFIHLIRALIQRLSALTACYTDTPLEIDATVLLDEARRVRLVDNCTRWLDLKRYSTRQKTKLGMGGVIGYATYEAADFTPFVPLLALAEWLHVGKLTTMGLGEIEVMRA